MCELCYGIREGCPNCDDSRDDDLFDDLLDLADEMNDIERDREAEDGI